VVGDEATYLMQAESLAWDLDLVYSREDFERFVRHWGETPEGLILQKGRGNPDLVYGKPFFYAAWAAPFVRAAPRRGPFVANAVLLALAAVATARAIRPVVGRAAPLWVAVFVFASVAFAHVFWAHIDLFLACSTALGLALVFGPEPATPLRRSLRWLAAGVLLAAVGFSRPLYLTLFLPAALAVLERRPASAEEPAAGAARGSLRRMALLTAGALLLVVAAAGVHEALAGSWTSYGAERRSFNRVVGFPEVDLPPGAWEEMIEDLGNASWLKRRDLVGASAGNLHLWAWNGLYLLAGQSVGLLPYFLPVVLALLGRPRGAARWGLLAAAALTAAAFLLVRPFNFYGGGGALANRYFLPVYPALWFAASRPVRLPWLVLVPLAAAPFLWPLWTAPRAYPLDDDGVFRHVSAAAGDHLPFETTQNHLKPAGQVPEVVHRGLWVKLLDPDLSAAGDGSVLVLDGPGPASLLLGRGRPLSEVALEIDAAAMPLDVGGGRVVGEEPGPEGWHRLQIELDRPRAVHPMWWTEENFYLYRLTLDPREDLQRAFAFTITPLE